MAFTLPSVLDGVENSMVALIKTMTPTGGYNFDWSKNLINDEDATFGPFPQCVINPTDSFADRETNVDEKYGKSSDDYTNEVVFTLLVKGELPEFSTNPNFDCRSYLRHALDDLKKLFGINETVLDSCDEILYQASQIEVIPRNDVQRPAQLRTIWKVVYAQDRETPSKYASS